MLENVSIRNPTFADEFDTLIELSEKDRKETAKRLKELDERFGHRLNKSLHVNSYDNDDYLFVADMLQDVRELHKHIYYDPYNNNWIRGNSEIPYIHFEFVEKPALSRDESGEFIPDDSKLNMGVGAPLVNGTHKLTFNYYWLKRYMSFLQTIFDDNEEEVITLNDIPKQTAESKTRSEILQMISGLKRCGLKQQAESLQLYANCFTKDDLIPCPALTFFETKGRQICVWSFVDGDGATFRIPMKKTIYNTSGFAPLFEERNSLVSELFINSLKMILAHEVAHVARGHWLLRMKEPEYSMTRNVMMNCEINADWTAATWLINELLYDTVDGNPCTPVICYNKTTLIYLWSVRIFAAYLSLSWFSRNDDRIWSHETITEFVSKDTATHPIYQFRLFCMLNRVKEHLDHMGRVCEKESQHLYTADKCPINKSVYDEVWKNACDMIFSFEYAFRACWNSDERSTLDKIRDSLFIVPNAQPETQEKIPFYMCYMDEAIKELEEYESEWQTILDKLRKYGMFFRM